MNSNIKLLRFNKFVKKVFLDLDFYGLHGLDGLHGLYGLYGLHGLNGRTWLPMKSMKSMSSIYFTQLKVTLHVNIKVRVFLIKMRCLFVG